MMRSLSRQGSLMHVIDYVCAQWRIHNSGIPGTKG